MDSQHTVNKNLSPGSVLKMKKEADFKRTHWIVQVTIQMLMLFYGFLDMENLDLSNQELIEFYS